MPLTSVAIFSNRTREAKLILDFASSNENLVLQEQIQFWKNMVLPF